MEEIKTIIQAVSKGDIKPLYILHGEEPFFIDKAERFLEENLLTEDEKGFNQTIFYGKDATANDIINACRRFPMMSERQVVILREAKDFGKMEELLPYFKNPQPSTVFIICYKYDTFKNAKISKEINEYATLFKSEKIKDYKLSSWIQYHVKSDGFTIMPKAAELMAESLGNDLSKIDNELNKLKIILPKGSTITDEHIEKNIGISKEYN
ncbi:MAG: DNA polymerase III subunit delta, partial [Flavobacterium sp.]